MGHYSLAQYIFQQRTPAAHYFPKSQGTVHVLCMYIVLSTSKTKDLSCISSSVTVCLYLGLYNYGSYMHPLLHWYPGPQHMTGSHFNIIIENLRGIRCKQLQWSGACYYKQCTVDDICWKQHHSRGRNVVLRSNFWGSCVRNAQRNAEVWMLQLECCNSSNTSYCSSRYIWTDHSSNIFSITVVNTNGLWVHTLKQFQEALVTGDIIQ